MKQNPLHSVRSFRTGKDVASLLNRQENSSAILNVSPPSNETESTLYVIWKNLLSHDNFGVKNDFFKIGGNSLKAVQLVSRIVKEFLVNIQLTEIFLQPTIEKLAIHILRQEKSLLSPSIISIQPKPNQIPLSFSQERLWFIDQLEGSIQYHIPMVLHIKGELNKEALGKAWQQIVDRHEVLRTVFKEEGGQPYQILKEAAGWQLSMVDGTKYKQEPEALLQYIQQLINEPFDLSKNYMIRASLITVSDYEHVLALTMHHITTDAWSIPLIIKEVIEFYTALTENCPARLVPLTIQYADYALWERNYLQDEVLNSEIDYWKNKLENVSPLQLPTDYKRPPIKGIQGAAIDFSIGKTLSDQLQMLSHQQDTTLFMTLLAAFKILLHRYSGQQDICVGTSIANRRNPEVEELIGFFVNTLALRSEVNSDELFTDFLQQVKATTIEAYEHQDLSFEKVVKNVAKERDVSRSALFQVMLVMQNIPEIKEFRLGEVQLTIEELAHNTSKFDLTFFISETVSGLQVHVEYSTDLYNELTISRMLGHFKTLLGSIVKNPLQKISELSILTSEEEQQLLYQFNESKVEYPRDRTIIDLFEEQAAKTPETTAAVFEEEQLNYKQLNKKANQLAHYLRDKGVKEETLVPICIDRGLDMIIGILGILKAGGAYVPIDPEYPQDRISYMLEDTGATIAVGSKESRFRLQFAGGVEVIEINNSLSVFSDEPTDNLKISAEANWLAYVIYTSGSTGKPKGVMIEHRHLMDYVFGLKQKLQIDQCKSFALVSTMATDLGNTVIYSSLVFGGALHVFSKETISNIENIHSYFRRHNIDCLKIVPSHWKALSDDEQLLLPAKLLLFGGEALQREAAEQIIFSGSSCRVVNHYGPTETTIGKLLHIVDEDRSNYTTIPIGKPFSNTAVYVLSKDLSLCPIGVPGQLYIAGDGVARGYLNNSELTNQKFIRNPFSSQVGSLIYGTGDLVKYLPDGNIEFIGRVDDQVKIRGYRIELGEIESTLLQYEGVSQGAVLAREDSAGNKRLVAYVVPQGRFKRESVISYLKDKLPDYMVPSLWVELESMPLTANGKINRKALPDPDAGEMLSGKYVAPREEVEEKLAVIWQEVLEADRIGIYDDFFELGGHSLLAVRLISAIRKEFEVEMPISDVFDYPTIASLATRLNKYVEIQINSDYQEKFSTEFEFLNI